MKRESQPHFLHEVVLPKDKDRDRRGSIEAEVGKDVFDSVVKALRGECLKYPIEVKSPGSIYAAAGQHLLITGQLPGTKEMKKAILAYLDSNIKKDRWTSDPDFPRAIFYRSVVSGERPQQDLLELAAKFYQNEFLKYKSLGLDDFWAAFNATSSAAKYRILTGQRIETPVERIGFMNILRRRFEAIRKFGMSDELISGISEYRALRAHDIKFIPGKGIEIIDDPPETYEKKTEPIPEERKF